MSCVGKKPPDKYGSSGAIVSSSQGDNLNKDMRRLRREETQSRLIRWAELLPGELAVAQDGGSIVGYAMQSGQFPTLAPL